MTASAKYPCFLGRPEPENVTLDLGYFLITYANFQSKHYELLTVVSRRPRKIAVTDKNYCW